MTRFQRVAIAGLLVWLAAFASGCSRCSDDAGLEAPRYRYTPGESLHFRYHLTQGLEVPDAPENAQGFVMKARLSFTVESVAPDGTATLDLRLSQVKAALAEGSNLRPLDAFNDFEKARYRIVQSAEGRLLSVEQTATLTGGVEAMAEGFARPLREMFPILPPNLSPRSDWTITSETRDSIPGVGAVPAHMTTRYQAEGHENTRGREGMRLKVTYAFTIGGEEAGQAARDPKDAALPEVDNRGEGEGVIWFDDRAGRFIGASYVTRVTVRQRGEREGVLMDNSRVVVSRIEVLPDSP